MAVYKRKYDSGTTLWYYKFQRPGAARGTLPIRGFGFATKKEAQDAEADRRAEEQRKFELKKAGSGVAAAPPKTLAMLLEEFFREHAGKRNWRRKRSRDTARWRATSIQCYAP